MSITSLNGGGANNLLLQQLLGSLSADAVDQTDGTNAAGSADSTGPASGLTLPPPAPPSDGQPSDLFSFDTLGALTATQVDASGEAASSGSSLLDAASSNLSSSITGAAGAGGDGDGGFSLASLTDDLEQAIGQAETPPAPPPTDSAAASAGTTSTGTAPASGSSSSTDPASGAQIADMLASLMVQYANASYSSQAATATAQTTATSITA